MNKNYIASELLQAAKEVQAEFDIPREILQLERKFESAIQDILGGIADYGDIMKKLERSEYPEAKEIGKRGAETARQRLKSWGAIQDDFFILKDRMYQNRG